MELPKTYNSEEAEDKIYALWEKSGFFQPKADHPNGDNPDSFSIAMPPPNATGELHIGHAMFLTLQDILTRYHRMKGDVTLWLPGTDHAAIATQNKVEKILLKKEGKTRHDLGRDDFLRRVNQYVKESQEVIRRQIRKMGSSCDWSRERYTLDAGLTMAVQEVFVRMHNDGLIYRGQRVVNWCTRCESTLADDEVVYREHAGKLYYIVYKLKVPCHADMAWQSEKLKVKVKNSKLLKFKDYLVIATTRPETKIGDTAVAVHPEDKRYKHLVGQEFDVQLGLAQIHIKIIADKSIDPKFGSGALGVTPGHSAVDFEMAQKNGLNIIKVIDEKGRILIEPYAWLNVKTARQKIVADLQQAGLIEKIKNIKHNLSVCYRCNTPVEPLVSKQWFIDVNKKLKIKSEKLKGFIGQKKASLKEIAIAVVKKGEIDIIPKKFEKIYYHWMENLRDWCISRQIWFGHRIPVWYCQSKVKSVKLKVKSLSQKSKVKIKQCNNVMVSIDKPKKCPKCGAIKLKQDPDTLDTWFSSGLWTFSTLGWPNLRLEVIASRHGTTDAHKPGVFVGQAKKTDFPLNKEGIKQAELLALKLKNEKFDVIFTADLNRTYQTAKIVNKYHHVKIIKDKRLREYRFGFRNGKTFEELQRQYPDIPTWQETKINQRYKDEETPLEMKQRVESFISDLKKNYFDKKIFIVTSGGVLDFFHMTAKEEDFQEIKNLHHEKCGMERYVFKNNDLANFHPTSVMETGYDILFFWVARMILMTTYALGEVPFKTVYLHGLVRDKLGRKMSKSLGNGIDPLDMIKKYGTDAVRLSLIIGITPGNDIRLYEEKIAGYRNFITKIWNIARYIMSKSHVMPTWHGKCQMTNQIQMSNDKFTLADKWILFELGELIKRANRNLEKYQFSRAGEDIYEFMWHKLADLYIEAVKIENQPHQREILTYVLEKCLILLHPFVPFVTEEIWGKLHVMPTWHGKTTTKNLKLNKSLLIAEPWVKKIDFQISKTEAQEFVKIQKETSQKRNLSQKTKQISKKETADLKKYIKSLEARLKNKNFLTKAPDEIIQKEKIRLSEALSKLA